MSVARHHGSRCSPRRRHRPRFPLVFQNLLLSRQGKTEKKRTSLFFCFVNPLYHTTHTTKAERRAQASVLSSCQSLVITDLDVRPDAATALGFLSYSRCHKMNWLLSRQVNSIKTYGILILFSCFFGAVAGHHRSGCAPRRRQRAAAPLHRRLPRRVHALPADRGAYKHIEIYL